MKPKYYWTGRRLFSGGDVTKLFSTIADAILDFDVLREWIAPVPGAHGKDELKDWRGRGGWWVLETYNWSKQLREPARRLRGEFRDPVDAFEFAEMKAKKERDEQVAWHVEFVWEKADGRLATLETLPADWLTQTQKAREKARQQARRKEMRAAA